MKRSLLLILGCCLLVAATLSGLYLGQPSSMDQRVRQLEAELKKAQEENIRLRTDNERLQITKKADVPPSSTSSPPNNVATTIAPIIPTAEIAESVRKMTDPTRVREMMNRMHEGQLDVTYGRLFKQLGLKGDELAFFKKLLSERQSKQTDIMMKVGQPGTTAEQRKGVTAEMAAAKNASDEAIRHFLNNDDDYATFQQWENTRGERLQVQETAMRFDAADASLTSDQREQLLNVIVAARKNSPAFKVPGTTNLTPLEQMREREALKDESILQQASAFMTQEQLDILRRSQEQRRAMYSVPATPKK